MNEALHRLCMTVAWRRWWFLCTPAHLDDVRQEASLAVHVHLTEGEDLLRLLSRSLHALAVATGHRRADGGPWKPAAESLDPCPAVPSQPSQHVQALAAEVRAFADDLPPRHRRALNLWLSGFSHEEVGEQLGVNKNTAATWADRGLRGVRAAVLQNGRVRGRR